MEGPLKELARLEKLTSKSTAESKSNTAVDSLESLLQYLNDTKSAFEGGSANEDTILQVAQAVDTHKREVEDRQKEVYSSLSRLGKALDKVCFE
jgi:hypothetical protein